MRNWAGNHAYAARAFREPASIDELAAIVRSTPRVRVLGSRHSFNDVADTDGDLVSLARLPRRLEVDPESATVVVDGGARYGEVCPELDRAGWALPALASLPHISVAGACATASHGSGDERRNLASVVSAVELLTGSGELVTASRAADGEAFDGMIASLGALGVVTALTLDLEPSYRMRQDVWLDLPLAAFADHFADITSSAESVSFFSRWRGPIDQVWMKRRVDGEPFAPEPELYGARLASIPVHPIASLSAEACTPQLGAPGPWYERLPHFRLDHVPSSGDELQSEYFVPRDRLVDAVLALDRLRDRFAPLVQVSEIRTIAADGQWLSMAFGRPSAAIHFTWLPNVAAVREALPVVEAALAPFEPRPHWGKLFVMDPAEVAARYPMLPAFADLARRLDPAGRFTNDFVERYVLGPG
ncbi:MAG TPA: FAD-binding protein [Candidatus Limnocylindrales bacterium]|nr:FAD-binding protein [Candidatus Limnocylindrales bacterium]